MTWNLAPLFKGDDDPRVAEDQKRVQDRSAAFVAAWKSREDWLQEPAVLREALDDYEKWRHDCGAGGDSSFYFGLRSSQDENDPALKAKARTADELAVKVGNDMQFFTLKLAKTPADIQQRFLAAPELERYRHFLERLFAET